MEILDLDNIANILRENKPLLSDSSIKSYTSSLRSLSRQIGKVLDTPQKYIKYQKEILDSMKDANPSSRKTRIAGIISILDTDENQNKKDFRDAIGMYRQVMLDDVETLKNKDSSQQMSAKQKENYISWDEVMKIYNQLKKDVAPLWDKYNLKANEFYKLQDFVLLSSYVLIPPRRSQDFVDMKIRKVNPQVDNYIYKKNDYRLIFNSFKNAKRIGSQGVMLPKTLRDIYNRWSKIQRSDYLFSTYDGRKLTQQKITFYLNRIFGKKKISTSMLRHIFLTHKFGDVDLKELQDTTHDMGSSEISRTLAYVDKEKADE